MGDSPTKFEIWFRKRKPEDTWTLQCMSEDIKNVWTEEISKLLWTQAKRNRGKHQNIISLDTNLIIVTEGMILAPSTCEFRLKNLFSLNFKL